MKLKINHIEILSDLYTPVGVFLKLRDHFAKVLLLESSEYANKEGSYSFIAFEELSGIAIDNYQVLKTTSNERLDYPLTKTVVEEVNDFVNSFEFDPNDAKQHNGLFGFTTFEAIKYFEKDCYAGGNGPYQIPDLQYALYRFIIVFDHFKNVLTILENMPQHSESQLSTVIDILERQDVQIYDLSIDDTEISNMSDDDFIAIVNQCRDHCQRGDVFQVVPSRRYSYHFSGDEFNVYRKLRSINPSPYLFYFDYSSFKLFGSSPEAQIIIQNNEAEVHPIAGTIKRSMDARKDMENTLKLYNDPKENAEHVMLVDLARNDLSKHTTGVTVVSFKEVQNFSHVIHLVSKVKGQLKPGVSAFQVFADSFPQGTLSGAPKIKALELIEKMEPAHRGFYGGAIGMIGFENNINQAIIIRSFLSIHNQLFLQAGAGVVINSIAENELKEVNNKLQALKQALNY